MSGKRVILFMAIGIIATSAVMYTLYFLTRQLDYVPPSRAPEEPAAPHVRIADPLPTFTIAIEIRASKDAL
jgi:hypothetical protein